jgi:hypothetical protein
MSSLSKARAHAHAHTHTHTHTRTHTLQLVACAPPGKCCVISNTPCDPPLSTSPCTKTWRAFLSGRCGSLVPFLLLGSTRSQTCSTCTTALSSTCGLQDCTQMCVIVCVYLCSCTRCLGAHTHRSAASVRLPHQVWAPLYTLPCVGVQCVCSLFWSLWQYCSINNTLIIH